MKLHCLLLVLAIGAPVAAQLTAEFTQNTLSCYDVTTNKTCDVSEITDADKSKENLGILADNRAKQICGSTDSALTKTTECVPKTSSIEVLMPSGMVKMGAEVPYDDMVNQEPSSINFGKSFPKFPTSATNDDKAKGTSYAIGIFDVDGGKTLYFNPFYQANSGMCENTLASANVLTYTKPTIEKAGQTHRFAAYIWETSYSSEADITGLTAPANDKAFADHLDRMKPKDANSVPMAGIWWYSTRPCASDGEACVCKDAKSTENACYGGKCACECTEKIVAAKDYCILKADGKTGQCDGTDPPACVAQCKVTTPKTVAGDKCQLEDGTEGICRGATIACQVDECKGQADDTECKQYGDDSKGVCKAGACAAPPAGGGGGSS